MHVHSFVGRGCRLYNRRGLEGLYQLLKVGLFAKSEAPMQRLSPDAFPPGIRQNPPPAVTTL